MPSISTGVLSGGLPITSYSLEYNDGGTWTDLIGLSSDSLSTFYTLSSLTTGNPYSFRYRVKN